ncbi:zinc dependent phospholipase C family protein [Vibrio sp.]|nr:zinc dependent phospholipase C family protein [Vibrio sp.]
MPGTFAYIAALHLATEPSKLAGLGSMPNEAKKILSTYSRYAELGALSPDYPYLIFGDREQNRWAELMHSEKVGELIRSFIFHISSASTSEKNRCFAWLAGYVSHVITDITIHPVIERCVGRYSENKLNYRMCEIHQDTHLQHYLGLEEFEFLQRIKSDIVSCHEDKNPHLADDAIRNFWSMALTEVYSGYSAKSLPNINLWHKTFVSKMDEFYSLVTDFPLAHHAVKKYGIIPPDKSELDGSFLTELKTPLGIMHYDEIFNRTVDNIQYYLTELAKVIFSEGDDQIFLNWNLATGRCPDGTYTAWQM